MNEREHALPDTAWGVQMRVNSHRGGLEEAAGSIIGLIQTLPGVQEGLDDLHIALLEALSNAVIHGNREDPGKTVDICARRDGHAHVLIAVTDQGDGFDPAALSDPTSTENISTSHERGVFLMRHLVDDVEFHLGGRQVVLRKRIAAQPRIVCNTGSTVTTLDG
jgi:serine/threonine-protein kinase RsbW